MYSQQYLELGYKRRNSLFIEKKEFLLQSLSNGHHEQVTEVWISTATEIRPQTYQLRIRQPPYIELAKIQNSKKMKKGSQNMCLHLCTKLELWLKEKLPFMLIPPGCYRTWACFLVILLDVIILDRAPSYRIIDVTSE